jgi:hypothetical protein
MSASRPPRAHRQLERAKRGGDSFFSRQKANIYIYIFFKGSEIQLTSNPFF